MPEPRTPDAFASPHSFQSLTEWFFHTILKRDSSTLMERFGDQWTRRKRDIELFEGYSEVIFCCHVLRHTDAQGAVIIYVTGEKSASPCKRCLQSGGPLKYCIRHNRINDIKCCANCTFQESLSKVDQP